MHPMEKDGSKTIMLQFLRLGKLKPSIQELTQMEGMNIKRA